MDRFQSDKLRILSFFAIVCVLYIHSFFPEINGLENFFIVSKIQYFISTLIGRNAVPLFFIMSGFLYFRNIKTFKDIIGKIIRRIQSLLVPFLITCTLYALLFIIINYLPLQVIGNSSFDVGKLLIPYIELPVKLFYRFTDNKPFAFHLWFLRDLIVIVILTPLFYLYNKKGYKGLVLCVFLYFANILLYDIVTYVPFNSLFWFMLGAYFTDKVSKINIKVVSALAIIYIFVLLIELFLPIVLPKPLQTIIIIVGLIVIWTFYDIIIPPTFKLSNVKLLLNICSFSFFIYLFHEPFLIFIRKISIFILGKSPFNYLLTYIISPVITLLVLLIVGNLMKKKCNCIYKTIVGNR